MHALQRHESGKQEEEKDASDLILPCLVVLAIGGFSVYKQVQLNRADRTGYSQVPGGNEGAYSKPDESNAESVTEEL